MIDFIKANIKDSIQDWQTFTSMDFVSPLVHTTGEVFDKRTFVQDSLKITYRDKPQHDLQRVELAGSLHQFLQDGFNYQDFDFKSLFKSIYLLCETYSLNPQLVKLENLEIGVNVSPSFLPECLLNNAFSYGANSFVDMTNKTHKKIGVECSGSSLVKLYNKRHQFAPIIDLGKECVRYELHFSRMRIPQNEADIYTVADLLDPIKLQRLAYYLEKQFDRIVFLNQVEIKQDMNDADKRLIEDWKNPLHVRQLMSSNPQMFRKSRQRYLKLANADKSNEVDDLKRLINLKVNKMLQLDIKTLKQVQFYLRSFGTVGEYYCL